MRACFSLAFVMALLAASAAQALPFDDDAIDDCVEAAPHAVNVPFGDPIELRVLVLLDGVDEAQAAATMATQRVSYEPLGIDLTVADYQAVSLTGTDSLGLIDQSRTLLGGKRPPTAHLVYTFTDKDMTGGLYGNAVAGQADCIGGVAFDDAAFAVGELRPDEFDSEQPAKIGAHELGHLMGGHHHYGNCAEGVPEGPSYPCTLMFNDVGLVSLNFSTFNAAVVRGHAEQFAKPLPAVDTAAEPKPAPSATPSPSPSPSATPAPAGQPTPEAGAGSAEPPAEPSSGPSRSAAENVLCAAARRLLTRTRAAERKAKAARTRARSSSSRRRTARKLRDRAAARRAAQRSVRHHCR